MRAGRARQETLTRNRGRRGAGTLRGEPDDLTARSCLVDRTLADSCEQFSGARARAGGRKRVGDQRRSGTGKRSREAGGGAGRRSREAGGGEYQGGGAGRPGGRGAGSTEEQGPGGRGRGVPGRRRSLAAGTGRSGLKSLEDRGEFSGESGTGLESLGSETQTAERDFWERGVWIG